MNTIKKLQKFIEHKYLSLFILPILILLEGFIEISLPYFISIIIDYGVIASNRNTLISIIFNLFYMIVTLFILSIIINYYTTKSTINFSVNLKNAMFSKINNLSIKNIDELNLSNLLNIMFKDISFLTDSLSSVAKIFLKSIVIILGSIIYSYVLCPKYIILDLILVGLIPAINFLIIKKSYKYFYNSESILEDIKMLLYDNYTGIKTVKIFSKENEETDKYTTINNNFSQNSYKGKILLTSVRLINNILLLVSLIIILWYGSHSLIDGTYTIGSLTSFLIYNFFLIIYTENIMSLYLSFLQIKIISKKIDNILTTKANMIYSKVDNVPSTINGTISFEDVSFKYNIKDDVISNSINNINFTINKGEFITIIGDSNSGKEVLTSLIGRFYDPSSGKVLVDNIDIRNFSKSTLQKSIAFYGNSNSLIQSNHNDLQQDILDSIESTTDKASKLSQLNYLITLQMLQFENNTIFDYDNYSVYKHNTIIRPLTKDTKILIIDESMKNTKYKDIYLQVINKHLTDLTIILLTSNISDSRNADKILLMNEGLIVVHGTHDELMKTSVQYKNICNLQF